MAPYAQRHKTTTGKVKTTAVAKGKHAKATPQHRNTAQQGKNNNKHKQQPQQQNRRTTQRRGRGGNQNQTPKYTKTNEIKGLEQQKKNIQRDIQNKEKEYNDKEVDVKERLTKIEALSADIDQKQRSIDTIQHDIHGLDDNIGILNGQISTLESELGERRDKFISSMRYMARHRSIQDKLMFIFSAKSLTQMYRRLRFVHEYAAYQRAQGELLKQQQQIVSDKHDQLKDVRGNKSKLLIRSQNVHAQMENSKAEQQGVVASLQQDQATLQSVINQQRQKQSALDAQIDRLIAVEIEKARARAAQEARARAAAQAAAQRARAADQARKRAAAQRAAQENARRVAEARAREAKARAEAQAAENARRKAEAEARAAKEAAAKQRAEKAAREAAARRERAQQQAREAEAQRMAAERKAAAERQRAAAQAREDDADAGATLSSSDRALTGSFANNRGRLPMPLSGRIVSHFGQYSVEGLSNVRLSNSGINIKGGSGAGVRAVFRGEVSAVFSFSGTSVVMIRHGAYITVYANLSSVNVHKGQQVNTGQTIGNVGGDGILQFQLRKETSKLNPEAWLRH